MHIRPKCQISEVYYIYTLLNRLDEWIQAANKTSYPDIPYQAPENMRPYVRHVIVDDDMTTDTDDDENLNNSFYMMAIFRSG